MIKHIHKKPAEPCSENGKKSWHRLFRQIALISVLFTIAVAVTNGSLFLRYFVYSEESVLSSCADAASKVNVSDRDSAAHILQEIERNHSVQINLYRDDKLVYSSLRQSDRSPAGINGFDFLFGGRGNRETLSSRTDRHGGTSSVQISSNGTKYLVYCRDYDDTTVEVMVQYSIIENSAYIATKFVLIVTVVCLLIVLILSIDLSVRFTRPITEMNDIALRMTRLDFSRKATVDSNDEIGVLAGSLNKLSDSLSGALKELREKNAILEDEIEAERKLDVMRKGFVANVSHELKTPISIIQGYAEGLCDGMADDPASRERYCAVIRDECERMHKLVISLLELSRYESGIDINREDFDLSASVINIVDINSESIAASGAELELELREREPVNADRLMTEQVIRNYLGNALSHVDAGGKIRIYTEPYGDDTIRLCVYNSGSHIGSEDMENIWQSFYRVDKSHNRAQGRFGLGLSIVRAIMLAYGRDFGVFNTEDGVVFWIELNRQG